MAFNLGINIVETEGRASPAIAGAPTSVAGLVLRSRRGPADRAARVSSFQQFTARFGGHTSLFAGAYCVEGFFQNGGQEAWIARVVGSDAAAATMNLKARDGATDTLLVAAAYRGAADAGAWGNDLYVETRDDPAFATRLTATLAGNQPARLAGSAVAGAIDLAPVAGAPRSVTFAIDQPATSFVIALDAATLPVPAQASLPEVAAAINAQAGTRVVASVADGALLIVSRSKGAGSRVEVTASVGDTADRLGFAAANRLATGTAGANNDYTQAQVAGNAGLSVGDWVRIHDGISESWHLITAVTQQTDAGVTRYFVGFAQPAAADRHEYRVEDRATLSTAEFDLIVSQTNPVDGRAQVVETWEKLTLDRRAANFAPARVNDSRTGSAYVAVGDLISPFAGPATPAAVKGVRLAAGSDGSNPSTTDYRDALARFDTIAVQLLAAPEYMPAGMMAAVTRAGLDYCAGPGKGDCMFVGHTPPELDQENAKAFGQDLRAAKAFGALYWPWITVNDPVSGGPTRLIPPTGHVMGVYARTDQTRGVWKAPAGQDAILRGVLAVERDLTEIDHTDLVKNGSVNGIRALRGTGIVIDSSRTLSTDTRWLYVNVRLLFNYVKASLREGLRWVKQEPNRESLWNRIRFNTVTPFLLRLYQDGAFGPGAPEDTFTVICGPENNPPDEITLGNLHIDVFFFPSRPAETIVISIGQQDGRSSADER